MRRLTVTELSLLEAFFTSLVIGLAETYFPAFSLMKGASPIQAGVLVSVPMIFAIVFQWLLLKKFRHLNLSTWVPLAAGIQLVSLFGLTVLAVIPTETPVLWLLVFYSAYWAGYYSAIPAWNRWISDLVSVENSQKYFASRTRFIQFGIVTGLVIGGVLLHLYKLDIAVEYLFACLFSVCALFKFITYKLFRKHTESLTSIHFEKSKAQSLLKKHKTFFMRYTVYNLAVYLSAPFVASYLLTKRHLSYEDFMWVMIGLFAGKIFLTLVLSKVKRNMPPFSLLYCGALISAPLPILWPLCINVPLMFSLHFLSGLGLACFEMGLSLSFFKTLEANEKIEMISIFYFFNVITQVLGTLLGAVVLKFLVSENYESLFLIAGAIRLIFAFGLKKTASFGKLAKLSV
ncbi:MAG: MFS transporter [Bdellovibrio sp.]|nr:MFS transporter [Bdellovibrio sp.]